MQIIYKKIGSSLGLFTCRLDEALKWHSVHIISLIKVLKDIQTSTEQLNLLKNYYPSLAIFVLENLDKDEMIQEYMEECK